MIQKIAMNQILSNPYRIIGLLSNTSEKDVQKQKSKLTRFVSIGKHVESEFDFSFLGNIERSEISINKAFSAIEQNSDRVSHSLFWFLSVNSFDDTAIGYLIKGEKEKAVEILEKVTLGKDLTIKNYSSFNNIGTLYLCDKSKDRIKLGIEIKIRLIESQQFIDFVHQVADQTTSIDSKATIEKFCDELFSQLIREVSDADILKLFQNTGEIAYERVKSKITEDPIHIIENHVVNAKNNRKSKPEKSHELGVILYEDCKKDLEILKNILGKDDLKFKMIADNLAKEIMQCGIDFYNSTQETDEQIENALQLLHISKTIAIGSQTIERIESNIDAINEAKDNEINVAVEFMKSVKKSFEENKVKILAEVHSMPLGQNQTINWTKVNAVIENSIDWSRVVELLLEIIPQKNIHKIKTSQDPVKIEEFKSLVDFLVGKLTFAQVNKIRYLSYWKTEDTVSNIKFTFKSLPALVKWGIALAVFLVLVFLIWGDDGLETVFAIAGFFGVLFVLGWVQRN